MKIISVTPENIPEHGIFCLKNHDAPGFIKKRQWFEQRYQEGLRLEIIYNEYGEKAGFIEYVPAENAWRPVDAGGFMFIHCMFVYPSKNTARGFGARLIESCETEAARQKKKGIAVMTSRGSWIANGKLFLKNGFIQADQRGRFELMAKTFNGQPPQARLIDWEAKQKQYSGWHLLYANQCPWHEKSVDMMRETAKEVGIKLNVHEIKTAREAQNGPSGFGVFALLHDGRLLEDHYLSQRRFMSIVKREIEPGGAG